MRSLPLVGESVLHSARHKPCCHAGPPKALAQPGISVDENGQDVIVSWAAHAGDSGTDPDTNLEYVVVLTAQNGATRSSAPAKLAFSETSYTFASVPSGQYTAVVRCARRVVHGRCRAVAECARLYSLFMSSRSLNQLGIAESPVSSDVLIGEPSKPTTPVAQSGLNTLTAYFSPGAHGSAPEQQ